MNFSEYFVKIPIFLVFLLFPFAQERLVVFGVPIYMLEFLVMFSGIAFLSSLWKGSITPKRIPKGLLWGAVLLLAGAVITLLVNGIDEQELGALKSWICFPIAFAFLAYQGITTSHERRIAILLWFVSVFLVSLATLFIPGLSAETYDGRLRSFFPSPNHLAMFLVPGAVIGAFLLSRGVSDLSKRGKLSGFLMMIFTLPIVIWALVMTESFGGMVAFVSAAAVFLAVAFFQPLTIRRAVPFFCLAVVAAFGFIVLSLDWKTLASGEVRTSLGSRAMIWSASLSLIAEHPIVGIGMRSFEEQYLALQPSFPLYLEWAVPHPHNMLLASWLFTGVVGLIGFLTLSFFVLIPVLHRLSSDTEERRFQGLVLALFIAFLVQGLVDMPYFRNDLTFFFWAIVAFAASLHEDEKRISTQS